MNTYIYDLSDPITGHVRYVGKSVKPRERLAAHIREARQGSVLHSRRWIDGLLQQGLRPVFGILDEVDQERSNDCERFWIATLKFLGVDLTNRTPGGDGQSPGYKPSSEALAKMSAKLRGRKRTPEQLDRLRQAFRRPEVAARRSELMKQRYADPVASIKITGPTKGQPMSDEAKRKIAASWTPERKARHAAEKSAQPVDKRWANQLKQARRSRWSNCTEDERKAMGAHLLEGRRKAAEARRREECSRSV